jgi:hypothetical protein
MGMEGIGARVARKEDKRFITGKGRYTDDMVVPGMKHAHFMRSPHAHAKIKSIDTSAAEKMPGVIGILNGAQLAPRTDRQHHLRLDDPFQGRLADEHGRLAPAGPGHGALCRGRGRHRRCRQQGPGTGRGRGSGCRLRNPAGGHVRDRGAQGRCPATSSGSQEQPDLRLGAWRCCGNRCSDCVGGACHRNEGHQQPPGSQPDGAPCCARRL